MPSTTSDQHHRRRPLVITPGPAVDHQHRRGLPERQRDRRHVHRADPPHPGPSRASPPATSPRRSTGATRPRTPTPAPSPRTPATPASTTSPAPTPSSKTARTPSPTRSPSRAARYTVPVNGVPVTITFGPAGPTAGTPATATVTQGPLAVSAFPIVGTEGIAIAAGPIATFIDAGGADPIARLLGHDLRSSTRRGTRRRTHSRRPASPRTPTPPSSPSTPRPSRCPKRASTRSSSRSPTTAAPPRSPSRAPRTPSSPTPRSPPARRAPTASTLALSPASKRRHLHRRQPRRAARRLHRHHRLGRRLAQQHGRITFVATGRGPSTSFGSHAYAKRRRLHRHDQRLRRRRLDDDAHRPRSPSPTSPSPARPRASPRSRARTPARSCWPHSKIPTRWPPSPTSMPTLAIGGWGDGTPTVAGIGAHRRADRRRSHQRRTDLRRPRQPHLCRGDTAGPARHPQRHHHDRRRRDHHADQPARRRRHRPRRPAHRLPGNAITGIEGNSTGPSCSAPSSTPTRRATVADFTTGAGSVADQLGRRLGGRNLPCRRHLPAGSPNGVTWIITGRPHLPRGRNLLLHHHRHR